MTATAADDGHRALDVLALVASCKAGLHEMALRTTFTTHSTALDRHPQKEPPETACPKPGLTRTMAEVLVSKQDSCLMVHMIIHPSDGIC